MDFVALLADILADELGASLSVVMRNDTLARFGGMAINDGFLIIVVNSAYSRKIAGADALVAAISLEALIEIVKDV